MLIELSQLPQIIQEQILTAKTDNTLQIVQNGQVIKHYTAQDDDEQAYYDLFYEHFDIERMKEAIGETDENGRAKNTIAVPKGLAKNKEAFREWVKANAS